MFTPAIYRRNDTNELFTCIRYQDDSQNIKNLKKVTPGRGPFKGQRINEIFTGNGRLTFVFIGDWIVEDSKTRQWVFKDYQFRSLFTQL